MTTHLRSFAIRTAAISIATCSILSGAPASVSAAEAYKPDPALLAAAQQEGEVVLYTTHIVNQIVRPLITAFKRYAPGVDVKFVRANGRALVVRIINEAKAGQVQADVWCLVDGVAPILQGGLVETFEVPHAKGLPATFVDPKHRWVATNLGVRSAAYNTHLVPKEHAIRGYQDLLDPRLKGKIVWNPTSMTGSWAFIATVIKGMGDEAGMAYLRKLAKQRIVPLPIAIRAILNRVIAGEYAVGLEMNNTHVAISAAQGAAVKWVPLEPVTETLQVAGITKGAPHPNAGKLFIDFMVSKAGQEVFREHDYLPMHPDVPAKIPELKPEQGGYKAIVFTPDNLETEVPRWKKIYEDLFR